VPSISKKPEIKRPEPREMREEKERPKPRHASTKPKRSKNDIFTIAELNTTSQEPNMSYDADIIRDYNPPPKNPNNSYDGGRVKKFNMLMPLNMKSKTTLKHIKDNSADEKPEFDESYVQLCSTIAQMISNFSMMDNTDEAELGINNLVTEFRKCNPFFVKLSHFTGSEIIKNSNIIVIKNQTLYSEHEYNQNSYIILYGAVFLKNKSMGLYKECLIGESLGEESVLEHQFNKGETAKVIEETALIEITNPFLLRLKVLLKDSYPSDYMILIGMLKKNMMQKKSLRAIGNLKV